MPTLRDVRRALDMAGVDHRGYLDFKQLEDLFFTDAAGTVSPRFVGRPTTNLPGRWCRPLVYPEDKAQLAKRPQRPASAGAIRSRRRHVVREDHCHACHKLVGPKDERTFANGKLYHAACCVCGTCGKGLNESSALEKDGALWCKECTTAATTARAPRCPRCKEPVLRGIKIYKVPYHRECVQCAICDKHLVPLAGKRKHDDRVPRGRDGRFYCERCMEEHFGERCTSCGNAVLKFDRNPWTNESLCEACADCAPCGCCRSRCWDLVKLPDGRKQCVNCDKDAVHDVADARACLAKVVKFFRTAQGLGAALDAPEVADVAVELVDRQRLKRLAAKSVHGAAEQPVSVTVARSAPAAAPYLKTAEARPARTLVLLAGMPRPQMCAAIAHELCHAFLALGRGRASGERRLSQPLEEAVCELWAALWLRSQTSVHASLPGTLLAKMTGSMDPVYGVGYREADAAFQKLAVDGAASKLAEYMRRLRRAKALPGSFPREDPRSSGRLTTNADAAPRRPDGRFAGHTRARHATGGLF